MSAIHQFSAGFSKGDAISNEARVLRTLFRSWGVESEIFSELKNVTKELRKDALDYSAAQARVRPEDVVILHLSIGSPLNAAFAGLKCRKVILYHNITPPEYFRFIQEEIAAHLRAGFEQVRALAQVADLNLAVSRFNAQELMLLGYRDVQVMPMMLERGQWEGPADRRLLDRFTDGRTNLLFVGRGAPNKRIEDLLNTLYYVQRYVDAETRLIHAGSFGGLERYHAILQARAYELKLDRVEWLGSITMEGLRACYQTASVFVCMSEHEGFCIPLMEAMARGVPVVAFGAAAVPETLDGAGVLVREKRFDLIAETIGELARRPDLRAAVVAKQKTRVESYLNQDFAGRWHGLLKPLL